MAVVDVIGSLDMYVMSRINRRRHIIVVVVKLAHPSYSSIVDLNYFSLIFLKSETWIMWRDINLMFSTFSEF